MLFHRAVHTFHAHRTSLYVQLLDVMSSAYLLYSTFTRQFYLRNTEVAQWAKDICAALTGDGDLIYNYISLSIVSWIASSFLEYTSSVRLVKLYRITVRRLGQLGTRFSHIRWSYGRFIVILTATMCTVNSLALTLILWGSVHKSFENVSQDISVLGFLTVAALMRLLRQFMEGLTFIAGIAVEDFQWQNNSSQSKKLFGHTAFSSLVLLIHCSSLTYTFANQERKVWGAEQYAIFAGLWTDVIFQLVVCVWASFNSCCYAKLARAFPQFVRHVNTKVQSVALSLPHFMRVCTNKICLCVNLISRLYIVFVVNTLFTTLFVIVNVITHMYTAWLEHALRDRWQIEVDFDDENLQLVQVRRERDFDSNRDELVCSAIPIVHRQYEDPHHIQCQELTLQHISATSRPHKEENYWSFARQCTVARNSDILQFPPDLAEREPPEELVSTIQTQ